eukprot:30825-Pelagococcus_subviridis.AAC.7
MTSHVRASPARFGMRSKSDATTTSPGGRVRGADAAAAFAAATSDASISAANASNAVGASSSTSLPSGSIFFWSDVVDVAVAVVVAAAAAAAAAAASASTPETVPSGCNTPVPVTGVEQSCPFRIASSQSAASTASRSRLSSTRHAFKNASTLSRTLAGAPSNPI